MGGGDAIRLVKEGDSKAMTSKFYSLFRMLHYTGRGLCGRLGNSE